MIYTPSTILARTSSFWYRNVSKESQDKLKLAGSAMLSNNAVAIASESYAGLSASENQSPHEVLVNTNEFLVDDGVVIKTAEPLWFMPGRISVQDSRTSLVVGLDFYRDDAGHLIFREYPTSPTLLLQQILLYGPEASPFAAAYGVDIEIPATNSAEIAAYLRGSEQNPKGLQHALRAVARLQRLRLNPGTLQDTVPLPFVSGTSYQFERERIDVYYDHTPRTEVEPGDWFGEELVSLRWNDGTPFWWRVDPTRWDDYGQDLRGVLFDQPFATITEVNGKLRFPLSPVIPDDQESIDTFWEGVDGNDRWSLDSILNEGDTVSPLDFLYTYFLDHALLLEVDLDILGPDISFGVIRWFQANIPFGYLPVIRVKYGNVWMPLSVYLYKVRAELGTYVIHHGAFVHHLGVPVVYLGGQQA